MAARRRGAPGGRVDASCRGPGPAPGHVIARAVGVLVLIRLSALPFRNRKSGDPESQLWSWSPLDQWISRRAFHAPPTKRLQPAVHHLSFHPVSLPSLSLSLGQCFSLQKSQRLKRAMLQAGSKNAPSSNKGSPCHSIVDPTMASRMHKTCVHLT